MSNATATLTASPRLTILSLGDGRAVNIPRRIDGIDTHEALTRALEWATPADIHAELTGCLEDADAVGMSVEGALVFFAHWLDGAGNWIE